VTRILLDTSAYSALRRGHPGVLAAVQETEEIFVNATVLGELKAGFRGGAQGAKGEKGLADFLASPRVSVLSIDAASSDFYALIVGSLRESGAPIPTNDVWIAASAMQHGLRVVTTDSHFSRVPQILTMLFDSRSQEPPPTTGA
jgi:predicted nucleic acid-binding protein